MTAPDVIASPIHMESFFRYVGIALFALMGLVFFRAIKGPTIIDRMIAVNVLGTKAAVILILIGCIFHRLDMYVDLALTYALLNFLASIAAARLVRRRRTTDAWHAYGMGKTNLDDQARHSEVTQ